MKNLRRELKEGRQIVGTWLQTGSPIVAELMSSCGFDFICVDVEHSAVDLAETQQLFQAIQSGNPNCAAAVRVHGVDYALVKRYLDAGARAVIAPLVNSAADARTLVEATKYPPMGKRGVGFCRANQYGAKLNDEFTHANDEILVAVQIEHIDGVKNIDDIVAVPGIDAVFIGPYDLTASMGITGCFDHPEYIAARDQILAACKQKGVHAGIHVIQPNPEEVLARSREGYRLIAYSLDVTMISQACRTALERFKGANIHPKDGS